MSDAPQISALTRALRAGLHADAAHGAIVPPIYLSTNYAFDSIDEHPRYDYSRSNNPTRDHLAQAMATLEGGVGAIVVGTGMATVTLALESLVPVGGRVVAPHDAYGGTWRLLTWFHNAGRLRMDLVDLSNPDAVDAALAEPADLVWIETPSNPLMRVTDIAAVSAKAHAAGAVVVADNTFCSPVLQQPLALGADVVVHSTTKFINGHSDAVGGVVVTGSVELQERMAPWANALGLTAGAFDSYLVLRGLRTLDARVRVHQENTEALVELLVGHPAVSQVNYPGLASHPGHELAARQQQGFGSVLSFELAGGRPGVDRFVSDLRVFDLAESLGGIESLVCHPGTMTHASMTPEAQAAAGITPGLIRASVGIEGRDDLVADFQAALDRAL